MTGRKVLTMIKELEIIVSELEGKYPTKENIFEIIYDDLITFCEMPETKQSKLNHIKAKQNELLNIVKTKEDKTKVRQLIKIIKDYCNI